MAFVLDDMVFLAVQSLYAAILVKQLFLWIRDKIATKIN